VGNFKIRNVKKKTVQNSNEKRQERNSLLKEEKTAKKWRGLIKTHIAVTETLPD
jgi:hypothetical protein